MTSSAGVLVPCWRCGGEAELQEIHTGGKPVYNAVAYWNTRAPILSAEEMEMLEGME